MVSDFGSINAIGLQQVNTNFARRAASTQSQIQGLDNTIFTGTSNNASYLDSVEIQQQQQQQNVEILRQKLKDVMDEQGIIGNFWNGVKNFFNVGASSNKAEKAIEQYKKGEISFEEAEAAIDNFKTKQKGGVDLLTSIGTGLAVAGAIAAAPFTGGASLALGVAVGAGVKAGSKFLDRASNKVVGDALDAKQIAKDAVTGALDGAVTVLTAGIGKAAKTAGKAAGEVATTAAQTAGTVAGEAATTAAQTASVVAGEAATAAAQTAGTVAKEAAATTVKQTVKSAMIQGGLQGAKRGAITGAAMGGGNYIIESIFEDDVDFTLGGLVSSTVQGAAVGGAIGGATGAISSGIKQYKINQHAASIQQEAEARAQQQLQAEENARLAQEKYNKPFEDKLSHKSAEESASVFQEETKLYNESTKNSPQAEIYKEADSITTTEADVIQRGQAQVDKFNNSVEQVDFEYLDKRIENAKTPAAKKALQQQKAAMEKELKRVASQKEYSTPQAELYKEADSIAVDKAQKTQWGEQQVQKFNDKISNADPEYILERAKNSGTKAGSKSLQQQAEYMQNMKAESTVPQQVEIQQPQQTSIDVKADVQPKQTVPEINTGTQAQSDTALFERTNNPQGDLYKALENGEIQETAAEAAARKAKKWAKFGMTYNK